MKLRIWAFFHWKEVAAAKEAAREGTLWKRPDVGDSNWEIIATDKDGAHFMQEGVDLLTTFLAVVITNHPPYATWARIAKSWVQVHPADSVEKAMQEVAR